MKKIICAVSSLVVTVAAVVALCSFTSRTDADRECRTEASCQGKHCSYMVGCDCSGFAPKTNGDEWEKAYCKHCGHHKRYHN